MRKKTAFTILGITAGCLFLACVIAVMAYKADWRYIAWDYVTHIGAKEPWTQTEPEQLQTATLDELLADGRGHLDQSLLLINEDWPLPADFTPEVTEYDTEVTMNTCVLQAYEALSSYILQTYGEPLYVVSSFRTAQEQEVITQENDDDIAAGVGESEHQAGLALDVCVTGYGGSSFLKTAPGQYVNSEGWRYGFIIRYPYYGTDETGISFEPWHIRYVGLPHAELISKNRWTLEEYYEQFEQDTFYQYGDYLLTRQAGETFEIPETYASVVISPDNQGAFVLTFRMEV